MMINRAPELAEVHEDILSGLNFNIPLREKLKIIHDSLKRDLDFIDRISVAVYDAKSDLIKTFIDSSGGARPLVYYEAYLNKTNSLKEVGKSGRPRAVNDLDLFENGKQEHTIKIRSEGYGSSYTLPIRHNNAFWGFVFFNSYRKNCLQSGVLRILDLYGRLVSSIVIHDLSSIQTITATMKTASLMVHYRDPETGGHLYRMARYSRLIAQELAKSGKYDFNDEYIERIFLFSPLHDIGKIGIPDHILLKPARLNQEEFDVMKTHPAKGLQIIDSIIENFQLETFSGKETLRNIAMHHHETLDGKGYPDGLNNGQIPIEARIIAAADVFDALASPRPYKGAWSVEEAFAELQATAGEKLDPDCVEALIKNRKQIEELRAHFPEEPI